MSETASEPLHQWTNDLLAFHRATDKLLETLQSKGHTKLFSEDYVHDILVSRLRDGGWPQCIPGGDLERVMAFDDYANRLDDQIASQGGNG
jgi:hypothetical protein